MGTIQYKAWALSKSAPEECVVTVSSKQAFIDVSDSSFPWNWESWELQYRDGAQSVYTNPFKTVATVKKPTQVYTHNFPQTTAGLLPTYRYRIKTAGNTSPWSTPVTGDISTEGEDDGSGTSSSIKKYAETIGDGSTTTFVIIHNLNTVDVVVSIMDSATFQHVHPSTTTYGPNVVLVGFTQPPSTGAYRVVVVG